MWIIGCPARAAIVFGDTSLDGAAAVRVVGQIVGRTRASIAVRRCAFVSPRSTTLLVALIRLITRRGQRLDNSLPARGGGRKSP